MKEVLARFGVGNASVTTALPTKTVQPGQTLEAEVTITGGTVPQDLDSIAVEIQAHLPTEDGSRLWDIGSTTLSEGAHVRAGETITRTVSVEVPYTTPVTLKRADVWLSTWLDIPYAADPTNRLDLFVKPTDRLQAVIDALSTLGFTLTSIEDCDRGTVFHSDADRYCQEFSFTAAGGAFHGELDELELVPRPGADELELAIEVDRRGSLLEEVADIDERLETVRVESTGEGAVRRTLEEVIERSL